MIVKDNAAFTRNEPTKYLESLESRQVSYLQTTSWDNESLLKKTLITELLEIW